MFSARYCVSFVFGARYCPYQRGNISSFMVDALDEEGEIGCYFEGSRVKCHRLLRAFAFHTGEHDVLPRLRARPVSVNTGHLDVRSCRSVCSCNYRYVFATLVRGLPIRRQIMMITLTIVNRTCMNVSLGSNLSQKKMADPAGMGYEREKKSRGIGLAQVLDKSF